MEADQPITDRITSTDSLYTSIESTNSLLDRSIATVGTLQKGRSRILSELFDTQKTERFLVQLVILKRRRRTFGWHLTPSKQSQKERKILLCYRPPDECLHGKKIDDGKEKPQIIKFYDLTKGGNDIVDQLNDYYTTRSKSCCWVTVVLSYARVNGKTMWCLRNDPAISSTSSNDFSWNLAKALALLHV